MVNPGAAFGQPLLDVSVREPLTQVPTRTATVIIRRVAGCGQAGPRGQHPAVARTRPPTWPLVIGTRDSASRGLSCVTVVVAITWL